MRLRTTAPPRALRTLMPNRVRSDPLGRKKMANGSDTRRRPSLYTASKSARRNKRLAQDHRRRAGLDAREVVTPFFATCCKDFSAAYGLHAAAEAVFFMTAPHMRLKCTLRQRWLSHYPPWRRNAKQIVYAKGGGESRKARNLVGSSLWCKPTRGAKSASRLTDARRPACHRRATILPRPRTKSAPA